MRRRLDENGIGTDTKAMTQITRVYVTDGKNGLA